MPVKEVECRAGSSTPGAACLALLAHLPQKPSHEWRLPARAMPLCETYNHLTNALPAHPPSSSLPPGAARGEEGAHDMM